MRLSKQLYQDRLKVPHNWSEMETYALLKASGFVDFPYSGFPLFLPIGKKIIESISNIIRKENELEGFSEIYLPLVQHNSFLKKTGRFQVFSKELMSLSAPLDSYILAPTHEEFLINMAKNGVISPKQLPVKLFQIADKFRNIKKPKGILRSKQFLMCDMCSIDCSEISLRESAKSFEAVVEKVFNLLDLKTYKLIKNQSNYVDYVILCPEGETKITISDGKADYASQNDVNIFRSSSVAMYFIFEQFDNLQFIFSTSPITSEKSSIFLGTYGFGIQRCFHAIVEQHKDKLGINFPSCVKPFKISIITLAPQDEAQLNLSDKVYSFLLNKNCNSLWDDRINLTLKQKAEYSDFLGVNWKIVIGKKEAEQEMVTLKKRGDLQEINLEVNHFLENYLHYL